MITSSSLATIRWTSSDGAALVDLGLVFMMESPFRSRTIFAPLSRRTPGLITPGGYVTESFCHTAQQKRHGVWVPAFAGMTRLKAALLFQRLQFVVLGLA